MIAQNADTASVDLLHALAHELNNLGRTGIVLQELLSKRISAGDLSEVAIMDAQSADLLVQHLNELANFLRAYAGALSAQEADPIRTALASVALGALVRRLSPAGGADADIGPSGELQLF
ncbi:hypothetical protein [Terricaulis sp.]|uniref:hypothetical protein n=1 Tax=Terricaulis sp. TaxID=2768686 RepID=UPI003784B242